MSDGYMGSTGCLHKQLDAREEAVDEAVAIMRDARGHYGIEECGGPGQPATEWDEIADRMQAFVYRYGGG